MFHTYVMTASGAVIDFDRAALLMDRGLLRRALRAMLVERNAAPRHDARYGAQWIWDDYCERHLEHYGEPFAPDVTSGWDSRCPPASAPQQLRQPPP